MTDHPNRPTIPVTDPKALRALAHPIRLSLMAAAAVTGPAHRHPGRGIARRGSASTSFHLRQLAEVRAGRGGRRRPRPGAAVAQRRALHRHPGDHQGSEGRSGVSPDARRARGVLLLGAPALARGPRRRTGGVGSARRCSATRRPTSSPTNWPARPPVRGTGGPVRRPAHRPRSPAPSPRAAGQRTAAGAAHLFGSGLWSPPRGSRRARRLASRATTRRRRRRHAQRRTRPRPGLAARGASWLARRIPTLLAGPNSAGTGPRRAFPCSATRSPGSRSRSAAVLVLDASAPQMGHLTALHSRPPSPLFRTARGRVRGPDGQAAGPS